MRSRRRTGPPVLCRSARSISGIVKFTKSRVWPTYKRLRSGTMRIDKLCSGSENSRQLDNAGLVIEGVEIVVHEADEPDQTKPS
jgi:hypothetical protein